MTWSVLDHRRVAKAGYAALREACQPVIVVADRPAAAYAPGDAIALDVHVVSDLRTPLEGVSVEAVLRWGDGEHRWQWEGDVPPDSCVRVGTVQALVPGIEGELALHLELTHADVKAANRYESWISPTGAPDGRIGQ